MKTSGKKITVLLSALIMLSLILSACGGKNNAPVKSGSKVDGAAVFPLTVKDSGGTEMTIGKKPVKIASLTLGTDEMLLGDKEVPGLVDKSRVICVTTYAIDPEISNVVELAKDVPNKQLSDAEKVIAMQPDLVIIYEWADPKFVKQVRDAGITVYVYKTPNNIEEQKNTVFEIAHIVGEDKKGEEMAAWMDGKLKPVDDKLKGLKVEDRLTVMEYSESGTSAGKGTNYDSIVTRAGLVNVVSKAGKDKWPQLTKEEIIQYNPDIITLPSWYYDKKNSLQGLTDTLKNDKSLATVTAIKEGRFLTISNPHISAISQYVVLGVEDVAKAAYPELFK